LGESCVISAYFVNGPRISASSRILLKIANETKQTKFLGNVERTKIRVFG